MLDLIPPVPSRVTMTGSRRRPAARRRRRIRRGGPLLHAARAEIAGQLLGIEPERVTRLDILRSHRKFGQPIPWDDAQRIVS